MHAACPQVQRRKQRVEVDDLPPAHERKRAPKPIFKRSELFEERRGNHDRVGSGRKLD